MTDRWHVRITRADSTIALTLAGYTPTEADRLAECFGSESGGEDIAVLLAHGRTIRDESAAIRDALRQNAAWLAALEG